MTQFRMMSFTPQKVEASRKFDTPRKGKCDTGKTLEQIFPIEVKLDTAVTPQPAGEVSKPAEKPAAAGEQPKTGTAPEARPDPEDQKAPEAGAQPQLPKESPRVTAKTAEEGPAPWKEPFEKAVKLHKEGNEGCKEAVKEAVKEAFKLLDKVRGVIFENNLVETCYDSNTALPGRDAGAVWNIMFSAAGDSECPEFLRQERIPAPSAESHPGTQQYRVIFRVNHLKKTDLIE